MYDGKKRLMDTGDVNVSNVGMICHVSCSIALCRKNGGRRKNNNYNLFVKP